MGKKIVESIKEAVTIARGEQPAARITIQGHSYVPEAEVKRLRDWLETIERLTDEEIGARFRTSSYKTEEQMAGKSVIYTMLSMPRNLARAALRGDAYTSLTSVEPR